MFMNDYLTLFKLIYVFMIYYIVYMVVVEETWRDLSLIKILSLDHYENIIVDYVK